MIEKKFDYVKKFLPLIGIVVLVYLIFTIGIDKIVTTILSLSPVYLLIAASLTIPNIVIRTYAWHLLLTKHKIRIRYLTTLKILLISYFYASITPSYAGHLIRIPYLKEKTGEPFGKLTMNTVLETSIHVSSLYIMMLIGAFLILQEYPNIFIITCVFVAGSLLIYIYFFRKERGERIFRIFIHYLIPKKIKGSMTDLVDTLYQDFPKIRDMIVPFLLGILTWIIIFSQIYIIGLSLGIQIPYGYFLLLYPIANVASFIPITFAGLGTRELTLTLLLSLFGVAPEKAVVLSLAGYVISDLLTGVYGLVIALIDTKVKRVHRKMQSTG